MVEAGLVAAVVSGGPSTLHALITRQPVLEGALAAGSILLPRTRREGPLLVAATIVHLSLSLGWAAVLAALLPRGREVRWSWAAGLSIAALDLGIVGRRFPRIRALQTGPQVADHLAYAAAVAVVLERRRGAADRPPPWTGVAAIRRGCASRSRRLRDGRG